jgi:adenylate kinase family enzyme
MKRVMVIGNAGGGKSTLCRAICAPLALPYHATDNMYWRPGWTPAPEAEFLADHDALIAQDQWLIDGYGPWASVEQRLGACDTVLFIDLPLRIHLWWAAKRQVRSVLFGRPDAPAGCLAWPVTLRMFRMIWQLHFDIRPKLIEAIYQRADSARIIHIRTVAELTDFAANPA